MSLLGSQAKVVGACFVALVAGFMLIFMIGFSGIAYLALKNASGSTTTTGGGVGPATTTCGQKSTAQTPPVLPNTGSIWATTPSSNGYYYTSTFGCSGSYIDSGDACDGGGCPFIKEIMTVNGLKKLGQSKDKYSPDNYEKTLEYFIANQHMFGCSSRVKVTNPKTGKAVVVKPADTGPQRCAGLSNGCHALLDMSYMAMKAIDMDDGGIVKAEKVADDTPIGPYPPCSTTDAGFKSLSCTISNSTIPATFDYIKEQYSALSNPT